MTQISAIQMHVLLLLLSLILLVCQMKDGELLQMEHANVHAKSPFELRLGSGWISD